LSTCAPAVKEAEDRRQIEEDTGLTVSCQPDDPDDTSATATGKIKVGNVNDSNAGTANEIEGENCDPTQSEQNAGNGSGQSGLRPKQATTTTVADDPQPNTISEAFYLNPSGQPAALLQDDYPATLPLPFTTSYLPASLTTYSGTCAPNTYAYALSYGDMSVKKIATCPPTAVKSIALPDMPVQVRITPDGTTAIVTGENNAVYFINTVTDAVTTIPTSLLQPLRRGHQPRRIESLLHQLQQNYAGYFRDQPSPRASSRRRLFRSTLFPSRFSSPPMAPRPGSTSVKAPASTSSIPFRSRSRERFQPRALPIPAWLFSPDGTRAYIALYGGSLAVYNTATLALVATIPVSDQPADVVVNKSGSRVYVTSRGGASAVISIIDPRYNAVVGSFPGNAFGFTLAH